MSRLLRNSLIVALFFGLDKILALGRQILVARQFGLSYQMDAFNAANNIPDLLSALISGGALGVALIPVLSEYLERRGRVGAWQLFSYVLNLAFLVTGGLALLLALFASPLIAHVIAPGFPPAQQALAVSLMRLDLLAILVFSISGLLMAGLQANQHFLLPAIAPAMYNGGQIFGILVLAPRFGIFGLVYGVILGSLLHLGVQVPALVHYRFRWTPRLPWGDAGLRKVLSLMGPRVATMFFIQFFFLVRDNLASRLGEGAVSALNYGWFIMQVPETLFGSALAIVLLPTLAEYAALGEWEAFGETFNRAARFLTAVALPAAVVLALGLEPLIGVLGFDSQGVGMVVWAARAYLLGMLSHAVLEIASRAFYARQDARTPLLAAALNAILYLLFAVAFSRWRGYTGIALANTLAFTTEAIVLLYLLNRRVPHILRLDGMGRRSVAGLALAGAVTAGGGALFPPGVPGGALRLAIGALAALPCLWPEVRALAKSETAS